MMHSQSLTSLLPLLALLSLLLQPVVSTYTLYERREEQLQSRRLAYAQDNYDPNFALGPAHQARDEDDLLMRLYRREASNAEFYKKQGIIKDTPPNNGKRCKGSICTKEEMKKIIAEDTRNMGNQCRKLDDCKCPSDKQYGKSCLNGRCLCGKDNKKVADIANAFSKPVLEGMKKFGEEAQKILGDIEAGLKMAIKLGTWVIPGLGPAAKTALKALDALLPPGQIQTGNKKADEILKIMGKVI